MGCKSNITLISLEPDISNSPDAGTCLYSLDYQMSIYGIPCILTYLLFAYFPITDLQSTAINVVLIGPVHFVVGDKRLTCAPYTNHILRIVYMPKKLN